MSKLLTLEAWAKARYGDNPPHLNTLRRWVRQAKIVPVPKKHGRAFYVEETAQYREWDESAETQHG